MTQLAELGIKIESADIKTAVRDLDKLDRKGSDVERTTGRMAGGFKLLGGAIAAIGVGALASQIADTTRRMQSMESALTVAAGSAEGAAEMMAFVRDESDRLGLSVMQAGKEFARLAVAAKGTSLEGQGARDIFTAVAEASTALGLSADETSGALNAIQQMISKGTVSAEELRGQLGERLPGAFQAAARAAGVTTEELGGMLQRGEVMAEDLLPQLADELSATFGAQARANAQNMTAELNRFNNAVSDLLNQEDGMPGATRSIRGMTDAIQNPGVQEAFDSMVGALGQIAEWAIKAGSSVSLALKDMGDGLAAYAAAAMELVSFNLDGAKAIMAARKEAREENKKAIDQIWAEKTATEELARVKKEVAQSSQGEDQQAATSVIEPDEQLREKLGKRLETLREHFATEQELALMAYEEKMLALQEMEEENIATEAERNELRLATAKEYADRMTAIEEEAAKDRAKAKEAELRIKQQAEQTFWNNTIGLMGSGSKKMFEIGKKAAIARAVIDGWQAAVAAWNAGMSTGGPWAPAIAAAYTAASLAKTASMIGSIKSSSFSGGGSTSGGGVSVSTGSVGPVDTGREFNGGAPRQEQPMARELRVTVEGDGPHSQSMRKLLKDLADTAEDMGGINNLVIG